MFDASVLLSSAFSQLASMNAFADVRQGCIVMVGIAQGGTSQPQPSHWLEVKSNTSARDANCRKKVCQIRCRPLSAEELFIAMG